MFLPENTYTRMNRIPRSQKHMRVRVTDGWSGGVDFEEVGVPSEAIITVMEDTVEKVL